MSNWRRKKIRYQKVDVCNSDIDATDEDIGPNNVGTRRKKRGYPKRHWKAPFTFFMIGLITTSLPAFLYLIDPNVSFVIAGIVCVLFCYYGYRRFGSLLVLKEHLCQFSEFNHRLHSDRARLSSEVDRIYRANLDLHDTGKRLRDSNDRLREKLDNLRELQDNFAMVEQQSLEEMQTLQVRYKDTESDWRDKLYENERHLMHQLFCRVRDHGSGDGMSIHGFNEFENLLPRAYRARFDRLGGFNKLSGGDSIVKYEDFEMILDLFAEMGAADVDIEFEIQKTPRADEKEVRMEQNINDRKVVITKRFNVGSEDAKYKDMFNDDSKAQTEDHDDIAYFLMHLELWQYTEVLKENGFEIIIDLKQITNEDLKEMGINKLKDRKEILAAIAAYFDELNYNEILKKPIVSVDDALVLFFGISKYKHKDFNDLSDIGADEEYYRKTFAEQYGYRFISNDYKDTIWSRSDAEDWILSKRDELLIPHGYIQYNAVIFCGASHGSTHAMICSNGEKLRIKEIRSKFASNVKKELKNLPKVFIFNCCRTEYEESRAPNAPGTTAVDYSVTITSTEGDEVFGPTLSRYVATAFSQCMAQTVHETIRSAARSAALDNTNGTKVRVQECDYDINDVTFRKKAEGRGSKAARFQRDTRQISMENKLFTFLKKMNMEKFYDKFKSNGYSTVKSLVGMNDNTLQKTIGIESNVNRKRILKAIDNHV